MTIDNLYKKFQECNSIAIDSRKNIENSLFFCLKGEHFDGNEFAQIAFEKKAKYIVIDNPLFQHIPNTILVDNSLKTLQKLANYHRNTLQIPIIAITGSNGKTTTKELIASVLKQSLVTSFTTGNLNNHIGVPLTLLSITHQAEIAVIEMGANHPKEIDFLCKIAEPDFGYITNFGKAHLEGFLSLEGVIRAKSELYEHLIANDKMIFVNRDNSDQWNILKDYGLKYSFSKAEKEADVVVQINERFPYLSVKFGNQIIQSNLVGAYNIDNIAIAITMGKYFNISAEKIKQGIESYIPTNSRSQIINKKNNNIILLDAYNANPSSMSVAIDNFKDTAHTNKVIILGDMKELGAESHKEHQEVVNHLSLFGWKEVLLIGENFSKIDSHYKHFTTTDQAIKYLTEQNYQNTFFLIKGSRAMALERITEHFE